MCNGKEPVEVWGEGAGTTTITDFFTMEGYNVGLLLGIESDLGVTKEKSRLYDLSPLRVIFMATWKVQVLERVIHWVFHK